MPMPNYPIPAAVRVTSRAPRKFPNLASAGVFVIAVAAEMLHHFRPARTR